MSGADVTEIKKAVAALHAKVGRIQMWLALRTGVELTVIFLIVQDVVKIGAK